MVDNKKKRNIPPPTYFGANLKFLRRLKGLSQSELGEQIGISRNKIASYESGIVEPNAAIFLACCRFFEVSPSTMLEIVQSEHPVQTSRIDVAELNTIDKYLMDQFEQFVVKTNELTKIYDGYNELAALRRSSQENSAHLDLFNSFQDLLHLLKVLLQCNWSLIHQVVPSDPSNQA